MQSQQPLTLETYLQQSPTILLKAKTLAEVNQFFEKLCALANTDLREQKILETIREKTKERGRELTDAEKNEIEKKNFVIGVDEMFPILANALPTILNSLSVDELDQLLHRTNISSVYYDCVLDQLSHLEAYIPEKYTEFHNEAIKGRNPFMVTNIFKEQLQNQLLEREGKDPNQSLNHQVLYDKFDARYAYFRDYIKVVDMNDRDAIAATKKKENLEDWAQKFSHIKIAAPKLNIEDIHSGNYFSRAKAVFIKHFLPKAKGSKLKRYMLGDPDTDHVRTKDGAIILSLKPQIDAIEQDTTLTEQQRKEQLDQAFVDMYYQLKKDQSLFGDSLTDTLKKFITSPVGLNLPAFYGPAFDISNKTKPQLALIKGSQDQFAEYVSIYFNGQEGFDNYMRNNDLGFKSQDLNDSKHENKHETINLKTMTLQQKARVRYIVFDHARHLLHSPKKNERELAKGLMGLLSQTIINSDKKNYPFSVAYQKLITELSPLHYKQHNYKQHKDAIIRELIKKMENIRNKYPNDEQEAYQAMKQEVILAVSKLKKTAKEEKNFFSSILSSANQELSILEKFLKEEFKVTKVKRFKNDMEISTEEKITKDTNFTESK